MTTANGTLKGVVLDLDSLAPQTLNLSGLEGIEGVEWQYFDHTVPSQTLERVANADIVLSNKVKLDAAILEQAPNVRYVGILATGMNNLDTDYCAANNIEVNNVSAYGTPSVAQHTLMLMLMLSTSVQSYTNAVGNGDWSRSNQFCLLDYPIAQLAGKHLVIVGYGELGRAVAKLAEAFDMRVSIAARPGKKPSDYETPREALDSLLADADFVSLHCALSAQTDKLIDASRLSLMKNSAFLINTARGGLVDEGALISALQSGAIAGAAVDVVSTEPPPSDNPLVQAELPNLIVTPHIAWAAVEARQRLLDIAVEHLRSFINAKEKS